MEYCNDDNMAITRAQIHDASRPQDCCSIQDRQDDVVICMGNLQGRREKRQNTLNLWTLNFVHLQTGN